MHPLAQFDAFTPGQALIVCGVALAILIWLIGTRPVSKACPFCGNRRKEELDQHRNGWCCKDHRACIARENARNWNRRSK